MLVIVLCIVIFGVLVEANINSRVHAEYIRRRQVHGQSIFNELPAGVHAEYIRRRQAPDQHYDKILQEILVRKYRRHHTPRVRPHLRQQQRSGGNIHI
jgi:hypothetical protein